jgi:hypothetical protein
MNDLYLGDAATVVASSGVTLTDAATGGDHTQTVVPGATYAVTASPAVDGGHFHFGVATILTAANILWVCCTGETVLIRIPDDVTSLHYQSLANGGTAWLRRLEMV